MGNPSVSFQAASAVEVEEVVAAAALMWKLCLKIWSVCKRLPGLSVRMIAHTTATGDWHPSPFYLAGSTIKTSPWHRFAGLFGHRKEMENEMWRLAKVSRFLLFSAVFLCFFLSIESICLLLKIPRGCSAAPWADKESATAEPGGGNLFGPATWIQRVTSTSYIYILSSTEFAQKDQWHTQRHSQAEVDRTPVIVLAPSEKLECWSKLKSPVKLCERPPWKHAPRYPQIQAHPHSQLLWNIG